MREQKGKSLIAAPETFVIIDIETTGLMPGLDHIIEVGAIKYDKGVEIDRFSSLIKPPSCDNGVYIDDFITKLTGITNEMLDSAPSTGDVLSELSSFVEGSLLIGHNINFDINFLYDNFQEYLSKSFENDFVDTMRLSRMLHPEEPHHRLSDLCKKYKLDYSAAHRSVEDCKLTFSCYEHLLTEIIEEFGDFDSFLRSKRPHKSKARDISPQSNDFDITHPLYGKTCVFTGTLEKMLRKEAMQLVANLGGINSDSVTKKTNYLILGNNDYCKSIKDGKSNKQKKAEKLKLEGCDIEVLPESVFYDLLEFE